MDTNEKINLWLQIGETIGVPQNQIQAVRDTTERLSEGVYKVTWSEKFGADSAEDAANLALVMIFADGNLLRPDRFSLSVEGQDGVVKVDLSGPKFLAGLWAGLNYCSADLVDSDEQALIGSNN